MLLILLLCTPIAYATWSYKKTLTPHFIIKYNVSNDYVNISADPSTYYNAFNMKNYSIFRDDAQVNDSITWGVAVWRWDNLTLNISSPVTATGIGIIWEYAVDNTYAYQISTTYKRWYPIPNVNDECRNFTVTGTCIVKFNNSRMGNWTPIAGAYFPKINAYSYTIGPFAIRARINYVNGLTSGGRINYTAMDTYVIKAEKEKITLPILLEKSLEGNYTTPDGEPCVQKWNSYYFLNCDMDYSGSNFTVDDSLMFEIGNASHFHTWFPRNATLIGMTSLTIGTADYRNFTFNSSYVKYWNNYFAYDHPSGYLNFNGNLNVYGSTFLKHWGGFNDMQFSGQMNLRNSIIGSIYTGLQYNYVMSSFPLFWYIGSTTTGYIYDTLYHGNALYFYSASIDSRNMGIDFIDALPTYQRVVIGVTNSVMKEYNVKEGHRIQVGNNNVKATCLNCRFQNYTQFNATASGNSIYVNYTLKVELHNISAMNITNFNITVVDYNGITQYNAPYDEKGVSIMVYNQSYNVPPVFRNPINLTITYSNYIPYKNTFNLSYNNRYQTFNLGTYPFDVNGILNMSRGKEIRFVRCSS